MESDSLLDHHSDAFKRLKDVCGEIVQHEGEKQEKSPANEKLKAALSMLAKKDKLLTTKSTEAKAMKDGMEDYMSTLQQVRARGLKYRAKLRKNFEEQIGELKKALAAEQAKELKLKQGTDKPLIDEGAPKPEGVTSQLSCEEKNYGFIHADSTEFTQGEWSRSNPLSFTILVLNSVFNLTFAYPIVGRLPSDTRAIRKEVSNTRLSSPSLSDLPDDDTDVV